MSTIGSTIRRITLLTDFGTRDGFAAAMRGVIASIAPDAIVDDASHDIAPGDVEGAAWALANFATLYPPGTIHVAVIDPGVGSGRRAIAARAGGQIFVAPDNGVLTRVLDVDSEIVEVRSPEFRLGEVSYTFHGRDVFAPAAAHLARGIATEQLGPRALGTVRLELPQAMRTDHEMIGEVVHVDRFGNLITNIPGAWIQMHESDSITVRAGDIVAAAGKTYAEVESGEMLAYVGSAKVLEIAMRDGNAAAEAGIGRGARVTVHHANATTD